MMPKMGFAGSALLLATTGIYGLVCRAATLVLLLVSLPAVVIPAMRAGRVDPLTAARNS